MKFLTFIKLQDVANLSLPLIRFVIIQSNAGENFLSVSINSTVTSTVAFLPAIVFMLNAGYERAIAAAEARTSENGQTTCEMKSKKIYLQYKIVFLIASY